MSTRYIWGKYTNEIRYYWDVESGGNEGVNVPYRFGHRAWSSSKDALIGILEQPELNRNTGKATYSGSYRSIRGTNYEIDTEEYEWCIYATYTGDGYNGPTPSLSGSGSGTFTIKPLSRTQGTDDENYKVLRRAWTNTNWKCASSYTGSDGIWVGTKNYSGSTWYDMSIYSAEKGNSPDEFQNYVSSRTSSSYPSYDLDSDGYFYYAEDQDNIDPDGVTIPDLILYGDTITITVDPSGDAEASNYGTISYRYERSVDGGQSWQLITTTPNLTQTFKIPDDATKIKFRVRAQDNIGYTSADYVESKEVTISAAGSLAISGEDKDLGTITSGIDFYVSSEDVTEALVTISTSGYSWKFTAQVGQTYTIDIFDLVNGSNTVAITATSEVVSGTLTATRTYQYTKAAQEFETGDAYAINQNGSIFYPLLVAEGVKLSDGRTLDVALSSIMERLKQIEQQAS